MTLLFLCFFKTASGARQATFHYTHAVCLADHRRLPGGIAFLDGWSFKNQIKFENKSTLHLSLCGLEKQIHFTFYVQYVCAAEMFVSLFCFFCSVQGGI